MKKLPKPPFKIRMLGNSGYTFEGVGNVLSVIGVIGTPDERGCKLRIVHSVGDYEGEEHNWYFIWDWFALHKDWAGFYKKYAKL